MVHCKNILIADCADYAEEAKRVLSFQGLLPLIKVVEFSQEFFE